MFSIIISEKGGAERKEAFDKNEINVGRVQGNDLVLPKGNVSKHHARLLFRDGRFIVTDLKSTNGTYVNGRKIAQATIVREGDKVYIGDFVMRLDTAASGGVADDGPGAAPDDVAPPQAQDAPAPEPFRPPPPKPSPGGPTQTALSAGAAPPPRPKPMVPSSSKDVEPTHATPDPVKRPPPAPRASTMPIDQKPRVSQAPPPPAAPPAAPSAPMAPPAPRIAAPPVSVPQVPPAASVPAPPAAPPAVPAAPPAMPAPPAFSPPTPPPAAAAPPAPPAMPAPPAAPPAPVAIPKARQASGASSAPAGRALALLSLMNRVGQAIDLSQIGVRLDAAGSQSLERTVREQASALRGAGEVPESLDMEALVVDAMAELLALGPLGQLLEDDDVTEIHCLRHDQLLVVRNGNWRNAEVTFTSDHAAGRALARLLDQSGGLPTQGEVSLERNLARGAVLSAVLPPLVQHYVFTVRKRRVVEGSLDDLVRASGLSRAMGSFLEAAVSGKTSVFVAGPNVQANHEVVAALVSLAESGERIAFVQSHEELAAPQARTLSVQPSVAGVHAAARLQADRLVVTQLGNGVAAALIDAVADGQGGAIAAGVGQSLTQALARFGTQLVFARPGLGLDAARQALAETFELAIEVGQSAEGNLRILRIAELDGVDQQGVALRDVFVAGEGKDEAAFTATGHTPELVARLTQRGVRVDAGLFKKG